MKKYKTQRLKHPILPPSVTHHYILLTGLISFFAMFLLLRAVFPAVRDPVFTTSLMMAAYGIPVALMELGFLKTFKNTATNLVWSTSRTFDTKRILVKITGLATTLAIAALAYSVFTEYHGSFYTPFYNFILYWAIPFLIGAPIYIALIDQRMKDPFDGYWHLGALVLGYSNVHTGLLKQHALGWLVKLFFLPLMYVYFTQNLTNLLDSSFKFETFDSFYTTAYSLLILLDVGCIVVGYTLTLRILDNHIRTTEPTLQGWLVAVACYQPLWGLIGSLYLPYEDNIRWTNFELFIEYPLLKIICGSLSLFMMGVYTWASLSFGLRFSNLTHRGIITNGPYRFSRHPAYVCKNISWWLESLPMLSKTGRNEALRNIIRLALVNLLYFIRAKTEERHLAWDPVYRQYARWIDSYGWLRWLNRHLPWVKFQHYRKHDVNNDKGDY